MDESGDADGITLTVISPDSPEARDCRAAYFAELAHRFEHGFDPMAGKVEADADMRAPAGAFLLARRHGRPIGCVGYCRFDVNIAEIKRMWTSPEARGLGIARRMLDAIERLARRNGYSAIRLDTNRALAEAIGLYRRAGYRDIARYNDNPYADFWLEKRLD